MDLGLNEKEISDFAQRSAQLILAERDSDSAALKQYKTSAEFRAGVQLACAAMVLVLAENNRHISRQIEQLQSQGKL